MKASHSSLARRCALCGIAFLLVSIPLFAGLSVRNDTGKRVWVAVGYLQAGRWCASGWYFVPAGGTEVLIPGDVSGADYYLHAYDEADAHWGGDYHFCTLRQPFNNVPAEDNCRMPGHEHRGFYRVDTRRQHDHTELLSLTSGCQTIGELCEVSGQLLRQFLHVALPGRIERFDNVPIGSGALLQFQVNRNGPVSVRAHPGNASAASIGIEIPIRLTDVQVDWLEQGRDGSIRRQSRLESHAVVVQATLAFARHGGQLTSSLSSDFTWNYKPAFPMFGRTISPGAYAEPYVDKILKDLTRHWFTGMNPLFQSFVGNDCDWQPAAERGVSFLNHFDVDEMDGNRLQELLREYLDRELQ